MHRENVSTLGKIVIKELSLEHVAPAQRILLNRADATRFAANAMCFDRVLVLSSCSDALRRELEGRGYTVAKTSLHAFLHSGGSACCLTLRLDHQTRGERVSKMTAA
jgi:N-dimethylarginine dimethylaminohydrolase